MTIRSGETTLGAGYLARSTGERRLGHYSNGAKSRITYKLVHRLRAEAAVGHPLPSSVVVHHADGSVRSDAPLVICENQAYHNLLHQRTRAVRACGHASWLRCIHCKIYAAPEALQIYQRRARVGFVAAHQSCVVLANSRRAGR